jgi:DNA-binding response OmpR family regulator
MSRIFFMEPVLCLLIDDDQEDHEIFNIAIQQANLPVECITMSDPDKALETLNEGIIRPEYIFVDVNMPKKGAKECIQRILEMEFQKNARLIAISTFSNEKEVTELQKMGAKYIKKPSRIDHYEAILLNIFAEKLRVFP